MGSSTSRNVSKSALEAVSNVASSIVQNLNVEDNQSQIISVSDVIGDIDISNNTFTQKATINMSALLNAMVDQSAQQKLTEELTQSAKSLISGINLFNFSNAQNQIENYVKAVVNITTNINQLCAASNNNSQQIIIQRVKGDVTIQNNVFDQMTNIFTQCLGKAISENAVIQELQSKIDQSSSSETKGLNLNFLIIIGIIIIIVGIVVPVLFSKTQVIFALFLIAGIVFLSLYFLKPNYEMVSSMFSTSFENNPYCDIQSASYSIKSKDLKPIDAETYCKKDKTCKAYSYHGQYPYYSITDLDKGNFENYKDLEEKEYKIYSSINLNEDCKKTLSKQDKSILSPIIKIGFYGRDPEFEDLKNFNVFINSNSSDIYVIIKNQWNFHENIRNSLGITDESILVTTNENEMYNQNFILFTIENNSNDNIYINGQFLEKLNSKDSHNLFVFSIPPNGCNSIDCLKKVSFNFDQLHLEDVKVSEYVNTSGMKKTIRNKYFLYLGIFLLIVGCVGFFIFLSNRNSNKK